MPRASFEHRVDPALLRLVECGSLRRLGGPHDGGYLVPIAAIEGAATLLSFGVSADWSFERAATALNPSLTVHAYDHTVRGRKFVKAGIESGAAVIWRSLGLNFRGARASIERLRRSIDYFRFFRGRVHHHRQRVWYNSDRGSAAIADIIAATGPHADLSVFAKIDIEGSEYRVLPYIAAHAQAFAGLVIEFHDSDICADALNAQLTELRERFEVVHVHGNNYGDLSVDGALPLSLEVTLMNKSLFDESPIPYRGPLPRPGLDAPNDSRKPDYTLDLYRAASSAGS